MKSKNIAIGLAAVALSIASAPAAFAISLITVMPASHLAISGNNLFAVNRVGGVVRQLDAATGAVINANFAPGGYHFGLAASGNYLYVPYPYQNRIEKYDITTGALINNFSTPGSPVPVAIDGNTLYTTAGTFVLPNLYNIATYNATSGAAINSLFVPGLPSNSEALAIDGNKLFVATRTTVGGTPGNGKIGVYDTTSGAAINSSLIPGLRAPQGLAISGNSLFVADALANTVSEYDATTGALINASLVSGLDAPVGLAISGNTLYIGSDTAQAYSIPVASTSVPEPFTIIGTLIGGTAALRLRKKLKSEADDSQK